MGNMNATHASVTGMNNASSNSMVGMIGIEIEAALAEAAAAELGLTAETDEEEATATIGPGLTADDLNAISNKGVTEDDQDVIDAVNGLAAGKDVNRSEDTVGTEDGTATAETDGTDEDGTDDDTDDDGTDDGSDDGEDTAETDDGTDDTTES